MPHSDFFIISASLFSGTSAWNPLKKEEDGAERKKKDECGLMGRQSSVRFHLPPKQDVETPKCSLNIPAQSVPFVRQR